MSARPARRAREAVDGVLLLDKPHGITSQTAVARAKALFNAAKAGHTGTLDPMATGLLPIAFGEATKFSGFLLDSTKGYRATVRLGVTTTTGDLEGEVREERIVDADEQRIESVLGQFRGTIVQTPPMFSALKHAGRPLYEYARAGTEIERAAREVTIHALVLESYVAPDAVLRVTCSKGTYVRVLAEDIGRALGTGACLAGLRRTLAGQFEVGHAVGFEALEADTVQARRLRLLPLDAMVSALPAVALDAALAARALQGQVVACAAPADGPVRVYASAGAFLGIAEAQEGLLKPRRLVSSKAANGRKRGLTE